MGESRVLAGDIDQVESYALDLKHFHAGSHDRVIFPILIVTGLPQARSPLLLDPIGERVARPVITNGSNLGTLIQAATHRYADDSAPSAGDWYTSAYLPTPTIIEAAQALYASHSVRDITRSDADARNLAETSDRLSEIVHLSHLHRRKSICFVTGVPGAGKTLVGLNIATSLPEQENAVFLSGNGPLVDVLQEALARDEKQRSPSVKKNEALRKAKGFVQNIHHFRDDALIDPRPPTEHVVVFDEAQRAWDRAATSKFMRTKKGQPDFDLSEPEFLIEIMDRHVDWCVIVALIGGGQEINTGEAGLAGWRDAISARYPDWDVYYSDKLGQPEYAGGAVDFSLLSNATNRAEPNLHLAVSMRSFRAQTISSVIHHVVGGNAREAARLYEEVKERYPIKVTRDLTRAKAWIREKQRGLDSAGVIASTSGGRLKPHGIHIGHKVDAPIWFLNDRADVRSSSFLEDAASEFEVQGLELDWTLVGWDADYRFSSGRFEHWSFSGTRWSRVNKRDAQQYLENAYRVLLTRARQGVVIFVPPGDPLDQTRPSAFYDGTYQFLVDCGFAKVE